ncbi:MAG TPA: hypothetical protein PK082_04575 [Phycisphaerae bacterium]|nr:hypothetical protein [Phycisphaerae bacterium]
MNLNRLAAPRRVVIALVATAVFAAAGWADEKTPTTLPVVILKADDLTRAGASRNPVSARWQAFADFIESRKIKASIGIIGYALEEDHPDFFEWIKTRDKKGVIEFWNHGYKYRVKQDDPAEFHGRSVEEQAESLRRTQKLAKEKLGIELKAFGPHWSGTDENTVKAIQSIPEIKIWFFGPKDLEGGKPFVLNRYMNLEYPTFVPDFEQFRKRFDSWGRKFPYLALQGHPNQWNEERFAQFAKIVDYLKDKGCVFMTASEYVESCRKAPATAPAK